MAPRPQVGECTPEAVAFYKALPHLSVTSSQDPSMTADILAYKKKFVAPPALREEIIAAAHGPCHTGINLSAPTTVEKVRRHCQSHS